MKPIHTFNVSPSIPDVLQPLLNLANNVYWDWNTEIRSLFQRIDRDLWENTRHNPVLLLGTVSQERLLELSEDEGFLAHLERAEKELKDYLESRTWYRRYRGEKHETDCFAYFCAEYGLTRCLPLYSGGLGVLAGDHLKSASDLGLPLVAVGLLYQEGYFAQYLTGDGWQQEQYPINDFYNMPLELIRQPDGNFLMITVEYPGRLVYARAWKVNVGTVPLYLLDTNIEQNTNPYDHDITDRLYGGDLDLRIHQEMMLGIGGIRLLKALGYQPTVYHLNEGHSAFLILERIKMLMQEKNLPFHSAKQLALSTQVFTTHTPVSAGFDLFPPDKTLNYVGHYAEIFGLPQEQFLGLGRENTGDFNSDFSMAALALKHASFINGVSLLHGDVSRKMFGQLWHNVPLKEVPITSITNGVHARSVVAPVLQELLDRYLGPGWDHRKEDDLLWEKMRLIPDEELWRTHERRRAELVSFSRERLVIAAKGRGANLSEIKQSIEVLNPDSLTIGFARRFATYKRANLFLKDLDRIKQIIKGNSQRQLQFIFAGKAHPKDNPGKELIRDIIHTIRDQGLSDHVVFLPGYNLHVSRMMISGCDVWLNTPRRPREASGTSGMKASMNGVLNLSVLDGWWDEADYINTGWAIGNGEEYNNEEEQDQVESNDLYETLEQEIIPLFYTRDDRGIPRGWVEKMKNAIRLNTPRFNTARMVRDYARLAYFPSSDRAETMTSNSYQFAEALSQWKQHLFKHWYNMKVELIECSLKGEIYVNQTVKIMAKIYLAQLTPDDVQVQLYMGSVDDQGDLQEGQAIPMKYQGTVENNRCLYEGEIQYRSSGLKGVSLRILPHHPHLSSPYEPALILWA